MKPIQSIRIKGFVPTVLVASLMSILLGATWITHHNLSQDLVNRGLEDVANTVGTLQQEMERAIRRGDLIEAEYALTTRGVDTRFRLMAFTDETDRILLSTQFALKGKGLDEALRHYQIALDLDSGQKNRPTTIYHPSHKLITAYFPLNVPRSQPEIRSLRTGHLVAIYDLSFQNARLWNQLLKTLIPLAITLAFISFVLGALIHRYITKPVEHLEKVTQRIAKGEYGAKSEVTGTGELSHLGKVINQMSSELESQNEHRLKIEEELKANREEYRTLVENSQDTILRFDQQNRICYANETASSLINTEATSQTQIAQTVAELPVSLSSFLSKSLTHVFQNGESLGQLHLWHYGQQDLVQDWRFIPEYDSDGSIQTVLAVARDITDFHKSREARDQLLAAIEQLSELVIVTDLQGTITYANSAAERMTGLPLPTLLDANLAEIAHTHGGFPFLLRLANRG